LGEVEGADFPFAGGREEPAVALHFFGEFVEELVAGWAIGGETPPRGFFGGLLWAELVEELEAFGEGWGRGLGCGARDRDAEQENCDDRGIPHDQELEKS
jgi:hypothetical protein